MAEPAWTIFGAVVLVLAIGLVWLARLSERMLIRTVEPGDPEGTPGGFDQEPPLVLYGNAVASHGFFGLVLLGAAWYAGIPWGALGAGVSLTDLAVGLGLGVGLAMLNEGAKRVLSEVGFTYSELLRELLTPSTPLEWLVLITAVLPVIAVSEELLFRAALIGALGTGFGVSPWVLALGSSILFGIGHGLQGPGGVIATGTLGGVLAIGFVLTNSLLVVVVAHYVVNLVEFARATTAPMNDI